MLGWCAAPFPSRNRNCMVLQPMLYAQILRTVLMLGQIARGMCSSIEANRGCD